MVPPSYPLLQQLGQELFALAPDAILLTDADGNIALANPQVHALLGYLPEELVGRAIETLIPEELREAHRDHRKQYQAAPATRPMGARIWARHSSGIPIPVEVHLSPIPTGDALYVAAFLRDLRPRIQIEEQVQQVHDRLQKELLDATEFVRSLLPPPMDIPPFSVRWSFQPSAELGGDALGYHLISNQHLAVYLLDVCGHGISPALLSIAALTTMRSQRLRGVDFTDPSAVMKGLSRAFPSSEHNGMFFSCWYGVLDLSSGELRFASAGHPPALMLLQGEALELDAPGTFLGLTEQGGWETIHSSLQPGACLLVYSDGAYELMDEQGKLMPYEAFVEEARQSCRSPNPSAHILEFAQRKRNNRPFEDDVSILSVCRKL